MEIVDKISFQTCPGAKNMGGDMPTNIIDLEKLLDSGNDSGTFFGEVRREGMKTIICVSGCTSLVTRSRRENSFKLFSGLVENACVSNGQTIRFDNMKQFRSCPFEVIAPPLQQQKPRKYKK